MSTEVVSTGRHVCDLPDVFCYAPSTVIRCTECGREWRAKHPGNPDYSEWRTALLGRRFRLRRRGGA